MKQPFLTKAKAEEIVAKYPTPLHVYDEKGIVDNARELLSAFSWNPGYKEYFAVKATPNPALIRLLAKEGCGVDCSSLTELMMAERLGLRGDEIMFSSNETAAEEFVLARKLDAIINLDDITHIDFLNETAGIPQKICLRFNPGGEFKINNAVMGTPEEAKYGLTSAQMDEAVERLMKLGVKEFGIHAFLASNTIGESYYPKLAEIIFSKIVELHQKTGAKFVFANLSGGVGVPYRPDQKKNDIFKIAQGVKEAYAATLTAAGIEGVKIFTELGRYMLAPYGGLLTRVIHFKHTYKEYVGVDACAAHLMRPAIYGAYHHITVLGKENQPETNRYDVVGSLCENSDKFAVDRMLPPVEKGDLLFIHEAGAHGHSMGYNYNGKLRSAEVLLHPDGTFDLIRRAEKPSDYFATLDIYPEFQ
ncbi:MAG TPA: diaminopimelate decarboxylase [Candidatus Stercoripulliclostridium merdipullorum]|uniref:Diaminopimelate decarboxylase n=1 Tax=Candidatus Stercoripulliclostridium merdipullorum TaxID=2840952 RepID=A0A9D1SXR3_9FIRM|nr:diaminopimelate decarboxylase [Candidatus Stercoripulliclostridium merdipullorum]